MGPAPVRIALLSDVHGNLSGLRAVATALGEEAPFQHVVVAGDHLQGGPRPLEVWEELQNLGWTLVRGNEDESLVAAIPVGVEEVVRAPYRRAYL
ncbi:MAG: metallophosphoesterase, partial [Chloroflexota bacterium]|nr:metallophosphoesterase [Chloroflexota bacterium]